MVMFNSIIVLFMFNFLIYELIKILNELINIIELIIIKSKWIIKSIDFKEKLGD